MADAIGFALALAVYGFSAWVGWRNIGILHAVIDKFSGTALLILSIFSP